MDFKVFSLAALAACAFVVPALAHHSFAMFDPDKIVTMTGTVKEFEWTKPRSWLRIIAEDQASGKPLQRVLKTDAPAQRSPRRLEAQFGEAWR